MYRKPASPGALAGVPSGPYTGGRKVASAAKLPTAARQRLADVLTGRADPTPILHEHPGGLASRFRATWVALSSIFALSSLIATGFADPRAAWAYQPRVAALGYAAASMLLGFSLLFLYRRRARASGGALVPGRYLLPLDVVEVPHEDRAGDQLLVVTPLGDARDARVRSDGQHSELVIVLEGGAEIAFALRNDREGEHAVRRLEQSQRLLEELTYDGDLEKALATDAFFDVRADDSWASLTPSGPASRTKRHRRAFLHGSLATMSALLVSAAFGWAAFTARNWASDRALYLRALRVGTTESLDAYLVRGTSHRDEATALRERLLEQRAELARNAQSSRARSRSMFEGAPQSEWELTPAEAAARRGTSEACIASLRARASSAHPEVTTLMVSLVERARRTGDPLIPVRLGAGTSTRPEGVPDLGHVAHATRMVQAFERIFSETCPASLLAFELRPTDLPDGDTPGVVIRIETTWPKSPTWKIGETSVLAPALAFEVSLRRAPSSEVVSFRLVVPPPDAPPASVRPRSLFVVERDRGDEAASTYRFLEARAFDRLYDELYGLFFGGDPRVPLRTEEEGTGLPGP